MVHGKPSSTPFPVVLTSDEFAHQVPGLAILAPVAVLTHLVAAKLFAAKLLHGLAASEFGYQLAIRKKFVAHDIVAKLAAKPFLALGLALYASHAPRRFSTAAAAGVAKRVAKKFATPYATGYASNARSRYLAAPLVGNAKPKLAKYLTRYAARFAKPKRFAAHDVFAPKFLTQ